MSKSNVTFNGLERLVEKYKSQNYIPYSLASCVKEETMSKCIDWHVQEVEFEQQSYRDYPRLKALVTGTVHKVPYPLNPAIIRDRMEAQLNNFDTFGTKVPKIKNVIFNPPATIVFWEDNTKTVVKAENEPFDPEKGLTMAFMKKTLGNKGNYFNLVKKWTEGYIPEDVPCIYPNIPKLENIFKTVNESVKSFEDILNSHIAEVMARDKEKRNET